MRATNLCAALAAAAVFAACTPAARAADWSKLSNAETSTGTTVIDYTSLINPPFDYVDLRQASDSGLSVDEIAAAAKLAEATGMPFRDVVAAIGRGETFASLADRANIRLTDLWNLTDEKQKIASYIQAYETTGIGSTVVRVKGARIARYMLNGREVIANQDLVDLASGNENLTMFMNAVRAAGLVDTLRGPGPFTIFAPSDAAFAALPPGTLDSWLNDKATLRNVLLYHVMPARVDSGTALTMTTPTSPLSVEGAPLQMTTSGGTVMVNGAKVIVPDLVATNGIIHIIDTVLTPPATATITTPLTPPVIIAPANPPATP